jgi:hypothetical protein
MQLIRHAMLHAGALISSEVLHELSGGCLQSLVDAIRPLYAGD